MGKMNKQARCLKEGSNDVRKRKQAILRHHPGAKPQHAHITATTIQFGVCGGKSEKEAFRAMEAKHRGAKWYIRGLKADDLK